MVESNCESFNRRHVSNVHRSSHLWCKGPELRSRGRGRICGPGETICGPWERMCGPGGGDAVQGERMCGPMGENMPSKGDNMRSRGENMRSKGENMRSRGENNLSAPSSKPYAATKGRLVVVCGQGGNSGIF